MKLCLPPTSDPRRLAAIFCLLGTAALGALAPLRAAAERPSASEWSEVSRVVAVGDVHGNLGKLRELLAAAELIDGEGRWIGSETHLVVAGDFLDRGLDDRALMDLLLRLQDESAIAGGRVHVLLGNHEVMNLFRDLRYVNPDSYRAFATDERKPERRAAASEFVRLVGGGQGKAGLRGFNRSFPPGYFARLRSFSPDGEYGSWLMGLPAVVKINRVVYTHGGLNEQFAALGIDGINRAVTAEIRRYLDARTVLEDEGVVSPVMDVLEVLEAARKTAERGWRGRASSRRDAAEELIGAAESPVLGGQGPLWYRGNALRDERLERDIVDRTLQLLDAKALVVAHSPTSTKRITSRFHSRLFRIDHGIGGSAKPLALVAEDGEILVLDSATGERTTPVREFPLGQLGAGRGEELPEEQLRQFLARSPVIAARDLGKGSTRPLLVELERGGDVRRGVFKTVDDAAGGDRYQHEVAAYRLDRALGLGMVPVTVLRTLDGRPGSLQTWVDGALDLEAARDYNLEFFDGKGKVSQLALARVFDALIGNPARKPADILGLVNRDQILLIDHSRAFSTSPDLPPQLDRAIAIPAPLAAALAGLDRAGLAARLAGLVDDEQIEALLARRDKLLARRQADLTASP